MDAYQVASELMRDYDGRLTQIAQHTAPGDATAHEAYAMHCILQEATAPTLTMAQMWNAMHDACVAYVEVLALKWFADNDGRLN
jgi:hypothetical protein